MATEGGEGRNGLESGLAGFQFQGVWKSSLVVSVPISRRKPAGNDLPPTSDIETRNAPVESALLERSAAVSSSTNRSTLHAPDVFELICYRRRRSWHRRKQGGQAAVETLE